MSQQHLVPATGLAALNRVPRRFAAIAPVVGFVRVL